MSRYKEHRPETLHNCIICGIETRTQRHHCVPRNALKSMGIKGTNNEINLVNVCGERDNDCHNYLDLKAINEHLFWSNGRLVSLDRVDGSTYILVHNQLPERRKKYYRR